jgi:hypothetical protein
MFPLLELLILAAAEAVQNEAVAVLVQEVVLELLLLDIQ